MEEVDHSCASAFAAARQSPPQLSDAAGLWNQITGFQICTDELNQPRPDPIPGSSPPRP